MPAALWTEALKLRRSWVPWLALAGFLVPALMAAVFVLAAGTPGLVGGKAQAMGITPDRYGYFAAVMQIDASGGLILFGILASWVFGREFSDRTAVDMLALPTSRIALVLAKFAVLSIWSIIMGAAQLVLAGLVCVVLGLGAPPWSIVAGLAVLLLLEIAMITPIALAASAGRGYLPGIAVAMVAVVLAVIVAMTGAGAWFPWSIPALASGLLPGETAGLGGYALVAVTAIAGIALTAIWWRNADFA